MDYIFKKFVNLGVFSRGLLVVVKPLALWLSINLDADSGLAIAQIYLIGLLFISLSGTNAHRLFYQLYFGNEKLVHKSAIARSYVRYIQKMTLQLIFVIIISSVVASAVFWKTFDVVLMGILFGIAEKLNDEFQRYAQFKNNSKNLFYLALCKLIPVLLAALLSYSLIIDIRFAFPILLLMGSVFVNWITLYTAIKFFIKTFKKSFSNTIKSSFNYIREDSTQILYVFMGITLVSIDKWLLQYFLTSDLPIYMLYTQIASVFIVAQTIVLIAPVRARLINENPQEIKTIKIGSPIFSLIPFFIAFYLYFFGNVSNGSENLGYFAFFFAAVVTYTVAYAERFYWATSAKTRLTLDASIGAVFLIVISILSKLLSSYDLLFFSLILLFCLLCLRVLIMMYMLSKTRV